jgi:transglutaminase-like putative cysteine protease
VLSEHQYLRVEAESVVMIHDARANGAGVLLADYGAAAAGVQEEYFEYLAPTNYVPHLPGLQQLIVQSEQESDGTCHGFVQAASDLVHRSFRYEQGATHVHSSIEDSLQSRAGVCQDFAHLLLAILRMRGFPGRYVSGYLVPRRALDARTAAGIEDVIGGQASHAWIEALLPETGWVGLDPTLGAPVATHHIRVAYGRDYGDVAPVRGVYRGHAGQRLSVDVRVRPALDGEGREHLQEITTGYEPPPAASDHQPQQQ